MARIKYYNSATGTWEYADVGTISTTAESISYDSAVAYSSGTVGKALSDLFNGISGINDLVGSGVIE